MFHIFGFTFLIVLTITCPPAAIITIPLAIIWVDRLTSRRAKRLRLLDRAEREKAYDKAISAW